MQPNRGAGPDLILPSGTRVLLGSASTLLPMGVLDVRGAIMRLPGWVLGILTGSSFGLGMSLFQASQMTLSVNIVISVLEGVFFGSIMGPWSARLNKQYRATQGPLPRSNERPARKAALRGPVPTNPVIRAASARAAEFQLTQIRRYWWGAPFFAVFGLVAVLLAISESLWWLLAVLEFTGFFIYQIWLPRHLERRRALLAGDEGS